MYNINNKKITILGAGESGLAAASLADYIGAEVFISDRNNQNKSHKSILNKISYEFGNHSEKCKNCDLIIISPGIDKRNDTISNLVKDKNLISEIEFASWFTQSPIIGITGSNGKSTTVKLLESIFKTKYKNTFLGGNIGIPFSKNVLLENKNNLKDSIHILELSSFQLENISELKPKVACILNLSQDHLDRHLTEKKYFKAKLNITKNLDESTYFIFNQNIISKIDLHKINTNKIIFGADDSRYLIDKKNNLIINNEYNKVVLDCNGIKLKGIHNYENILACFEIASIFGINDVIISNQISNFSPLAHRMEKINSQNKITFINDSKSTNIESTIFAINSSKQNTIIILGGYPKGRINYTKYLNPGMKNIQYMICYGKEGGNIYAQLNKSFNCVYIEDFEEAIIKSIKLSKDNDRILLSPACSSFDQFKNFEERGEKFKSIIKNYYK